MTDPIVCALIWSMMDGEQRIVLTHPLCLSGQDAEEPPKMLGNTR
jgi:hypothetical protein